MTVTLADIARAAGVSVMTASRVLNERGGAGPETRARVLATARELDYQPNALARSLRAARSMTVGVILPDITNPFFPEIVRGLELAGRMAGYALLMVSVTEDPLAERRAWRTLRNQRVDGVVVCSSRLDDASLKEAIALQRAVVCINRPAEDSDAASVLIDYRAGMALVVTRLVGLGVRRVAFLAGPDNAHGGRERIAGLKAALAATPAMALEIVPCGLSIEDGAAATGRLLPRIGRGRPDGIEALVCYNDLTALGALRELRAAGLSCPGDVLVVGCDDIPAAELVSPSLTSLRVDKLDLGRHAMHMLIERIGGGARRATLSIRPELILRESA
jgi:LacI family transcriptional regulator